MKQQSKDCLSCLGCFAGLVLVSAVGLIVFTIYATAPRAQNTLLQVIPSPNLAQKAVVFERNAGATTGFSTQVSLLPFESVLPDEPGNVLGTEGHPDPTDITVDWVDDKTLRVAYTLGYGDRVQYRAEQVGTTQVVFVEGKVQ